MTSIHGVLALALATSGWLLAGLLGETRRRLADRLAQWTLPDGQHSTFRLAVATARLAMVVAPGHRSCCSGRRDVLGAELLKFELDWWAPSAALAELEADLDSDERVLR